MERTTKRESTKREARRSARSSSSQSEPSRSPSPTAVKDTARSSDVGLSLALASANAAEPHRTRDDDRLEVVPLSSGRSARSTEARPRSRLRAANDLVVGIAYDLKSDFETAARRLLESGGLTEATASDAAEPLSLPDDAFEEYDSIATVEALERALADNGYRTRRLGSGRTFLTQVMNDAGDLVFNIAEGYGTRSREAHVPSALEMLGVPYTHSDPLTLAMTLDKAMAKRVAASAGVPTPRFAVLDEPDQAHSLSLRYPLIAKPLFEGSSMGIRKKSKCTDPQQLRELLELLLRDYREPVLVEEFCSGPEFTVGILGTGASARVIGAMEIVPRHCAVEDFVYSLEVKRNYQEEVDYHVPPRRPEALVRSVEAVALAAYKALSCRDVGRVDVRIGEDGAPKFLEVNPLPGLNPITGDLVILARGYGISYSELIGQVVESARARQGV
jgi:D-alanine-D-alanine ligase